MKYYLAIDVGASSGRHIVGWRENGEIRTQEVFRFPNGLVETDGHLTWDVKTLFSNIVEGIRRAFARYPVIESLSVDTWGIDYVLMDGDTEILPCYAHRDRRTEPVMEQVHKIIPFSRLYQRTGCHFQHFNTVYQLYDDFQQGRLERATDFLMVPEYLLYRLTGVKKKEYTNATTTGLICAETGEYDPEIVAALGLPQRLFGPLCQPGTAVGKLKAEIANAVGGQTQVVLCATHDTASAVEGIPMEGNHPYISSGTWSLLGVKTPRAITGEGSRQSNFSNEGGVGYIRYQKNIMGLWMVQSLQRQLCPEKSFGEIADEAEQSAYPYTVNADDPSFLAPHSMKAALDSYLSGAKHPLPECHADYFSCVFRSLAQSYRRALADMEDATGVSYDKLYIVGGGAKNQFLNRLTADACGKEVIALPIEATALGNLKLQMDLSK